MYDIIIIGAGIAGITSAIYASRANKKILIIESLVYGGQIVNSPKVENYPGIKEISGVDLSNALYEQAKNLEVPFAFEKVIQIKKEDKINIIKTNNNTYQTKTIIIATGTINRKLQMENEDKLIGKGISYCATCDGALYKNKDVAVIGGGNTALEEAIFLSTYCNKVYLINRTNKFKGENKYIEQIKKINNIEIIMNESVTKINGENSLESIDLINKSINIEGLFIAIGQIPNTEIFKDIINIDEYGYIISDESCKTNIQNIFVAGDCRTKNLRQLITASADGAIAVNEALKYLNN
ncbi:MAG: thioredoxin-disulfide reductase [Bacilli bacterium]|nr:thioredoxin-disulfide reductase [Bacilli bacterium]